MDVEKQNTLALSESPKAPSSSDEHHFALEHAETFQTTYEQPPMNQGLYKDGELILMPAASRDPKDPMNLPVWRKFLGLLCLSFFGALIASAELILGAALPVFAVEYSPIFQMNGGPSEYFKTLQDAGTGFPAGSNPLIFLELLGGPPIFRIYFLATFPLLVIGVSNLFLVPIAIAIGRRPVIIVTGLLAIAGASWAGASDSLDTHIAARCIQAIGAGSVESLIPFIIQDIIHVHERNTWISGAFACQGLIIIAIGFSAPYMIVNLSWRWLYHVTAIAAGVFLLGIIAFLPETRWPRTRAEMNGIPRDDAHIHYSPRTWRTDLGVWSGAAWMKGVMAFFDTMTTFFYPSILFVTLLNGSVIAAVFAAGFTAAPALLTVPWNWPFDHIGLCLIPVLIAAIMVAIITGGVADWFANYVAKKRGARIPENQLINLFLPWACSLLGALLFGISAQHKADYHWIVFLLALAFMAFGFLGTSTITTVYVLESYPHIAGPALVNVASFRFIMAFFLTLWASDWIVDLEYEKTFLIYTGLVAGFGLLIPVVYYYGPAWRRMFPATRMAIRSHD